MDLHLFYALVEKIRSDCLQNKLPFSIALYNWGDPLIHPQIGAILKFLHEEKITFSISTNLNHLMDFSLLFQYPPHFMRVSVSGFDQRVYQKGHRGGNVENVKKNLKILKKLTDEYQRKLNLHVFYLIYKDNCDENIQNFFQFTVELGFQFAVGLAYLMPLENMVYCLEEKNLSLNDKNLLSRLCFTPQEAFDLTQNMPTEKYCALLEEQVVVNYDGSLPLCCAVYSPEFVISKNYLNISLNDLQNQRRKHPFCRLCVENKMHWMALQAPMDVYNRQLRRKQIQWNTPYWVNLEVFRGNVPSTPFVRNPFFGKNQSC